MDNNYHKVTSELDAREVLRYLNYLGIHNISGEVLKYFITDLKKLIKYDLQQKENLNCQTKYEIPGLERLHSASTFSSRCRSKTQDGTSTCAKDSAQYKKSFTIRNVHSAPCLHQQKTIDSIDKPQRRACSCVRIEKKPDIVSRDKITIHLNNLIKVPIQPVKKKSDPVSLYHYYTSLWEKYKSNVPGENDWSELRWSVRQKMAGDITKASQNKVTAKKLQHKKVSSIQN
ncbi:hyls1 centriolar and ciliogenesis associated [Aphomia sociella]